MPHDFKFLCGINMNLDKAIELMLHLNMERDSQASNGQDEEEEEEEDFVGSFCWSRNCKRLAQSKCAGCRQVYYCGRECQKNDWKNHKAACKLLAPKNTRKSSSKGKVSGNVKTTNIEMKLWQYSREGKYDDLLQLFSTNHNISVYINSIDSDKRTALSYATQNKHIRCVKLLLDHGANVNVLAAAFGFTPLFNASSCGSYDIMSLLLDYGADVNMKTKDRGHTPLHVAANYGNIKCLELLLDRGANINMACDSDKNTPLHIAIASEMFHCVPLLTKRGANLNAEDNYKESPLNLASSFENFESMKILLENGANVHTVNDELSTPLHSSIRSIKCTKLLLDFGALVNVIDGNGFTPLMIACRDGLTEVVKLLIDNNADVNIPDSSGCTPLTMARKFRVSKQCVELLLAHDAIP